MQKIAGDISTRSAAQMMARQQGDISHCPETMGSQLQLPEDILHQIHALMPLQVAAQSACVSRAFLRSWRCFPNLTICARSLGMMTKEDASNIDERDFISRSNHIMENPSGMGVKTLRILTWPFPNLHPCHVDRWLQGFIAPGIREIEVWTFTPRPGGTRYSFPAASLLSSEIVRSSICTLVLGHCNFHCAAQIGCMSSLKGLDLTCVNITGEELYGFLSNSCALERLLLRGCNELICLEIPRLLRKLGTLQILAVGSSKLEMISSNAPNLSNFSFCGDPTVRISLGDVLQVRKLGLKHPDSLDMLYHASSKLPFMAPNLQSLALSTRGEMVDTPKLPSRFTHLKYLEIMFMYSECTHGYDFCSLISFLDASPALESLIIQIEVPTKRRDSIMDDSSGGYSPPWGREEQCHDNLRNVRIAGFCSAKSMIGLTARIINKAKALECLTLDPTLGHRRCPSSYRCRQMRPEAVEEATKAVIAIQRYIKCRVPSSVKLVVIEPCTKCLPRVV